MDILISCGSSTLRHLVALFLLIVFLVALAAESSLTFSSFPVSGGAFLCARSEAIFTCSIAIRRGCLLKKPWLQAGDCDSIAWGLILTQKRVNEADMTVKRISNHKLSFLWATAYSLPIQASLSCVSPEKKVRTSWNKGRKWSNEERMLISQRTREAMAKLRQLKLQELGITMEELREMRRQKKRHTRDSVQINSLEGNSCLEISSPTSTQDKFRSKARVVSAESRRKMSEKAKERWKNPVERQKLTRRPNFHRHSEATRLLISLKIKERWRDPLYAEKVKAAISEPSLAEQRKKRISETLRMKKMLLKENFLIFKLQNLVYVHSTWEDPRFRLEMMAYRVPYTEERRRKLSQIIRDMWRKDEAYRSKTLSAIEVNFKNMRKKAGLHPDMRYNAKLAHFRELGLMPPKIREFSERHLQNLRDSGAKKYTHSSNSSSHDQFWEDIYRQILSQAFEETSENGSVKKINFQSKGLFVPPTEGGARRTERLSVVLPSASMYPRH